MKTNGYGKATLVWAIGIAVFLVDMLTKYWVNKHLPVMGYTHPFYPYGGIPVFQNFFGIEFSISHATNKGAAWGMFASYQIYLIGLRILLIAALAYYVFYCNKIKSLSIPFTLIIAGAIANVVDYFLYGHVVDMLHFILWGYDYPVFNVADSSIFIGVCWLIIINFTQKDTTSSPSPSP